MWMRLRRHVQLSGLHGFMVRLLNLHDVVLLQHVSTWYDISNCLINSICCCNMEIVIKGIFIKELSLHQAETSCTFYSRGPVQSPACNWQLAPAIRQSGKSQKSRRKFLFSSLDYLVLFSCHTIFTPFHSSLVSTCDELWWYIFSESHCCETVVSFSLTSNRSTDSESVLGL